MAKELTDVNAHENHGDQTPFDPPATPFQGQGDHPVANLSRGSGSNGDTVARIKPTTKEVQRADLHARLIAAALDLSMSQARYIAWMEGPDGLKKRLE